MRIILIIGAVFCSIIGIFYDENLVGWYREFWWRVVSEPQWSDLFVFLFGVLYTILAFVPAIMLFRLRKVGKPKWRFILIGADELFVVGAYINLWLKYFVAWAN